MSAEALLSFMLILSCLALGGVIILTFAGFPSWPRIALARLTGSQYVLKLTRDNSLVVEGAIEREGMYLTAHGAFELEPEDAFSFNSRSSALWYEPYNTAVLARVMPLLRDLKRFGIDNYGHLMYLYNTPMEKIIKDHGLEIAEQARTIKGYDGRILQELEVIRIPDLRNYLEARSPAAENAVIERYIQIERRKLNNPLKNSNMIIMLVCVGLLGLCLGYIFATGHIGASVPAVHAVTTAGANMQNTLTQVR